MSDVNLKQRAAFTTEERRKLLMLELGREKRVSKYAHYIKYHTCIYSYVYC